ncbi:DUF3618 domain-containing protein [Mycobacterium sp. URHB0044]|jgi:hypothetical protein|uniref:DUF3618 domain-containing protein n=1 Tax=Mycobacterium sp. URHB0044 TaxID=1380386 RepID=UPI00049150D2|nr:DUF3618 domain-containing protein [Mycobacterium sp. URHB0044]
MTGSHARPEPDPNAGVEDLQKDIEQTRAELGETISALSDKVDVKARAQQQVDHTKAAVVAQARSNRSALMAAAVAGVVVIGLLIRRRRRRR